MNKDTCTFDIGCHQHQIELFLKRFCDYTSSMMPYNYERTFSWAHYIFMILLLCQQTRQGRQKLGRFFFSTSLARRSISENKEFVSDMKAKFNDILKGLLVKVRTRLWFLSCLKGSWTRFEIIHFIFIFYV